MQITVKSTTKESKQAQGKIYWGVKHDDGNWYNVVQDLKPTMGQRFECDVKETEFNGRTYRWATPIQPVAAPAAANNNGNGHASAVQSSGKIPWLEFTAAFKATHAMALEVEPDKFDAGMST